jgi:hypothetical protein
MNKRISLDVNVYVTRMFEYKKRKRQADLKIKEIISKRGRNHPDFERLNREIRDRYIAKVAEVEEQMKQKYGKKWRVGKVKKNTIKRLDRQKYDEVLALCRSLIDKKELARWKKRSRHYKIKIAALRTGIARLRKRNKRILYIATMVSDFFDIPRLSNTHPLRNLSTRGVNRKTKESDQKLTNRMARKVFIKYCTDQGIRGHYLSHYLQVDRNTVGKNRTGFIKSLQHDQKAIELWHRFKMFVKDYDPADYTLENEEKRPVGRPRKAA